MYMQRERQRESQAGSTQSAEPQEGLELPNRQIMTWAEKQTLNHPGAIFKLLNESY